MTNIAFFSLNEIAQIFRSAIMIALFCGTCIFRPPALPEGTMNLMTGIKE